MLMQLTCFLGENLNQTFPKSKDTFSFVQPTIQISKDIKLSLVTKKTAKFEHMNQWIFGTKNKGLINND